MKAKVNYGADSTIRETEFSEGCLSIDHLQGKVWYNDANGVCRLRIGGLPKPVPAFTDQFQMLDLALQRASLVDWLKEYPPLIEKQYQRGIITHAECRCALDLHTVVKTAWETFQAELERLAKEGTDEG